MDGVQVLFDASIKAMVVLALAGMVNLVVLRRASAARRHLVWSAAAVGALVMPVLSIALPRWQVLPEWAGLAVVERDGVESAGRVGPVEEDWAAAAPDEGEGGQAASASPETEDDRAVATSGEIEELEVVAGEPEALEGPSQALEGPAATPRESEAPTAPPLANLEPGERAPAGSSAELADSPPRSTDAVATPWTWREWVLAVWALVAAAALLPIALGMVSLRRLERGGRRMEAGPLADDVRALARELGLPRAARLLESSARSMPMHWGILRPRLLLPAGAGGWSRERLRVVLLHELAHARRRDCLTQLLVELACTLHWFDPLAWLARARMREEREVACDDLVLRSGLVASDYAEELLRVATGHGTPRFAGRAAIAMARAGTLEKRLHAILDARRDRRVAGKTALAGVAIACAHRAALGAAPPPRAGQPLHRPGSRARDLSGDRVHSERRQ